MLNRSPGDRPSCKDLLRTQLLKDIRESIQDRPPQVTDGTGLMNELDGSLYKGSLKRAQKHGYGEKHFADNSVY